MRKIVIWLLVVFLAMVVGVYMAKSEVVAPDFYNFTDTREKISPNNISEDIIKKINEKRVESKLGEVKISEKLSKAARARIAVIVNFGDYTGSVSALTREKALDLVDFESSVVGDITFDITNDKEDFLTKLMEIGAEKETILLPKFTEVGIAEIPLGEKSLYYLIFGNETKKVSAKVVPKTTVAAPIKTNWGGPDLWEAVNNRRIEFGVGKLSKKDELCTIASIRLNQLLELKKLDGHAGFQPTLDRSDLKWIGEKYNISEYLATGFGTPIETVKGWENTLGHRSLLTGGEYVWGCIYAQNTFAVAITAY